MRDRDGGTFMAGRAALLALLLGAALGCGDATPRTAGPAGADLGVDGGADLSAAPADQGPLPVDQGPGDLGPATPDQGEPGLDLAVPGDLAPPDGGPADQGAPPDDQGPTPDANVVDSGPVDGGPVDQGPGDEDQGPGADGGAGDVGSDPDGGAADQGTGADAGALDQGSPDQGPGEADLGPVADLGQDGGAADLGQEPLAGPCADPRFPVRLRVVAANLTTGNYQSYDPGHGARILQALQPDLVLIQEFNYGDDRPAELRAFVDATFGPEFAYFREPQGSIPNGVISRYPIVASGSWDDSEAPDRGYAWARIDVPGDQDLWAVSLHLLTRSAGVRATEARELVDLLGQHKGEQDLLVLGGDLNTAVRGESCLEVLSAVVETGEPWPTDPLGDGTTNANRNKPYDWVLADPTLHGRAAPLWLGSGEYSAAGIVFDTRIHPHLEELPPAQVDDSDGPSMQHMAVVRDFCLPAE